MGGRRAWLYILGIAGVVKFGLKRLRDTATDREMSTRTQELLSEAADVVEHAETRYLNELRAQDTVQILKKTARGIRAGPQPCCVRIAGCRANTGEGRGTNASEKGKAVLG